MMREHPPVWSSLGWRCWPYRVSCRRRDGHLRSAGPAVPASRIPATSLARARTRSSSRDRGAEYFGSPPPSSASGHTRRRDPCCTQADFPRARSGAPHTGPSACPKGSSAVLGTALGSVTFGGERVKRILDCFDSSAWGWPRVPGRRPLTAVIELLIGPFQSHGWHRRVRVRGGRGNPADRERPARAIRIGQIDHRTLGAAISSHGKTSTTSAPQTCPKGGFPLKTE